MRGALCIILVLAGAFISESAPPDKPKKKRPLPVPEISGECSYGTITQTGRKVWIDGHANWYVADGEIKDDGTLYVKWIHRGTGRIATGRYAINEDTSIVGAWAWDDVPQRMMSETLRYKPDPHVPDF